VALILSDLVQTRLRESTSLMLSPLEYANTIDWCSAVLRSTEHLLDADGSLLTIPQSNEALSPRLQESSGSFRAARITVRGCGEGLVVVWRRRGAGTGPLQATGVERERLVDQLLGTDAEGSCRVAVASGGATLAVSYPRNAADPARLTSAKALLELLIPFLEAGSGMLIRLNQSRAALLSLLGGRTEAALVVGDDGKELSRNLAMSRLLERGEDGERLLGELRDFAFQLSAARIRSPRDGEEVSVERVLQLGTPGEPQRVRGWWLPEGTVDRGGSVLLTIGGDGLALPSVEALVIGRGLTPREAEIARMLAAGVSTKQIALQLSLSPHTVRTHGERIFEKLNIHSRKALALELMSSAARSDATKWRASRPADRRPRLSRR
jgi:DNA-binding CsgD family transcriptional regulator